MSAFIMGGDDAFDMLAFGEPHPDTVTFLTECNERVSTSISETSRRFRESVSDMYRSFNASSTARLARAVTRKISNIWSDDVVKPLVDIGALQHARITMQRYIMAEPTVRELYHQQRCDGYSDSYVDEYPKVIGVGHYDYRRVTHGVCFKHKDSDVMQSITYYEGLKSGERNLHVSEQADILNTWDAVKSLLEDGSEDPTSKYNAAL